MPSAAYNPAEWGTFFSAQLGASATLAGLLFVSLSINLSDILNSEYLIPRAGKALLTLTGVLFTSSLCLVPRLIWLDWALVCVGTLLLVPLVVLQQSASRDNPYVTGVQKFFAWLLTVMSALPVVICGFALHEPQMGGLYWLPVATLFSFASALFDAWVLLVEIKR
jgi:hypothetical protein